MSAATPAQVPATRSPFLYLVSDPWIALSWLLLIGSGLLSVLLLLHGQAQSAPTARPDVTAGKAITFFLTTGYFFWSTYFGLAACWRFAIGQLSGIASIWLAVGCMSLITFGWMFLAFALLYAVLGGGIYQFLRRWWLLAHGYQPPFLRAPRRVRY